MNQNKEALKTQSTQLSRKPGLAGVSVISYKSQSCRKLNPEESSMS